MIKVVGFDPSMSNWGIATGLYDPSNEGLEITNLIVIHPKLLPKSKARQSHKDLMRAEHIAKQVFDTVIVDVPAHIFVEVPHGSQSARAMASYAMCLGVLGSCRALGWDFTEFSEAQVKMSSIGNKKATKDEMIEWAVSHHPNAPWPTHISKGKSAITKAKAEHMADAIATIYAGIEELKNDL